MPVTRRRRANPPDQPENNNPNAHLAEQAQPAQSDMPGDAQASEQQSAAETQAAQEAAHSSPSAHPGPPASQSPVAPQPPAPVTPQLPPSLRGGQVDAGAYTHAVPGVPYVPPSPLVNGNGERDRQDYSPNIEPGRRTARGEYFRRPPQQPVQQPAPVVASAPLQAPSHEIKLPLGREPGDATGDPLHLAYNPGYTGSEEARSTLLHNLAEESKTGGRARCWNCGSLAIVYECWNTRSRSFGEVGVAYCEICGVWSVM